VTRLLLGDLPKATLGFDCFELAVTGGFRGLRGVAAGFHRVELSRGDERIALPVVVSGGDGVIAFVLGERGFEPAPPSPLQRAAAAGDLDHALVDVSGLPAVPARAWRALTSRLASPEDASAWRAIEPPHGAAGWTALEAGAAARQVIALQGAWLAMNHDRDAAAADRLSALLQSCVEADRTAVARHPRVFADVLDGVAAMLVLAPELVLGWRPGFGRLLAACAAAGADSSAAAAAAIRLDAAWRARAPSGD